MTGSATERVGPSASEGDDAFQLLTEVDAVVLDKTGTLTEGAMALVRQHGDAQAMVLAAALERESTHPIATALHAAFDDDAAGCVVTDVEAVAGHGLRGTVDGRAVVVGRPAWIFAQTSDPAATHQARLRRYAAAGLTPVAVAMEGRVAATLDFGDRLRPDAEAVVARLRDGGRTVAMIGDGVNDMAALQAAGVGIAVEGGTTASHAAADVFLTRAGLRLLLALLDGAEGVMRVIRRNLGFSLAYNVVGAAAAMAGLVSPLAAAIAMPLSSLVVVTSSIAQRSFQPAPPRPATA